MDRSSVGVVDTHDAMAVIGNHAFAATSILYHQLATPSITMHVSSVFSRWRGALAIVGL
jgi:hypothetical protein